MINKIFHWNAFTEGGSHNLNTIQLQCRGMPQEEMKLVSISSIIFVNHGMDGEQKQVDDHCSVFGRNG